MRFIALTLLLVVSLSLRSNDSIRAEIVKIVITGNEKTQEDIIRRELKFREGESYTPGELEPLIEEAKKSLQLLSVFNEIHIRPETVEPGRVHVLIDVTERWYTWAWPELIMYDRNFNEWAKKYKLSHFSYGATLQQHNMRGRLEKLTAGFMLGFMRNIRFSYDIPYLNRKKTVGGGLDFNAYSFREIPYISIDNKLVNLRYHENLLSGLKAGFLLSYRPDFNFVHGLSFYVFRENYHDTILQLNPDFTASLTSRPVYGSVSYSHRSDFRDHRTYPLTGWFNELGLTRVGLPGLDDVRYFQLTNHFAYYRKLASHFYGATSLSIKLSNQDPRTFRMNDALGYENRFVRGYEYYVMFASNLLLSKTGLRYGILEDRMLELKWLPLKKFNRIPYSVYLGTFVDVGKTWPESDAHNRLTGAWVHGLGIGFDLNTYYDKVMRIEYSINRKGENAFYLHFVKGI